SLHVRLVSFGRCFFGVAEKRAYVTDGPPASPAVPATGCSEVIADRRRERRGAGGAAPISVSQYGQIFQSGSSGRPHALHGSLSLRMQLGHRKKSFSTSKSQYGQR